MNRQVAFTYATAWVAASLAAIVMVGSAFGFGLAPAPPATDEEEWSDPAAIAAADEDYEAQQAAYEASLAEYQQAQADAVQKQINADWWTIHDQRTAAQAVAAAEIEAQREAGLSAVEAQLAAQQAAAAAELQAWIDEQGRPPSMTSRRTLVSAINRRWMSLRIACRRRSVRHQRSMMTTSSIST